MEIQGKNGVGALALIGFLVLGGCGGGGGSSGSGGAAVPPPADVYFSPVDGATDVSVDMAPTLYVDNATIDCSLPDDGFTLVAEGGAAVSGTLDCTADHVTFTPDAPLAFGTKYVASVPSMQDVDGAVLCNNCTASFTTAAAPVFTATHLAPAASATGIGINGKVTATFSGPVECSTVNTSTFRLTGTSAVTGTVACSGSTATFTPSALLANSTAYTASLAASVRGTNGVTLGSLQSWSFTTSAIARVYLPAPLQPISGKWVEAASADADGNLILLYGQRVQSNGVKILSATRYKYFAGQPNMTGWWNNWSLWSQAGEENAKVAMSKNGNALVLGKASNHALMYAYYHKDTDSWSGESVVSQGGAVSSFQPVIDDNGNAMLVWSEGPAGSDQVYARYYNATSGTLGAAQAMGDGMWPHFLTPRFAFDANGNGTVVFAEWQSVWDGSYTCGIASRNYDKATDTWSSITQIVPNGHANNPDIAFDGNSNAVVVWAEEVLWDPQDASTAYWMVNGAIRASGSSTWVNAHVGVGWDPKGDASNPRVVTMPNGDAMATWNYTRRSETVAHLNAAFHPAGVGQEWSPLGASTVPVSGDHYLLYRVVGADAYGGVLNPSLVVDKNNKASLVYSKSDGTRTNVYMRTFSLAERVDGASGWSDSVQIDTTDENAAGPVVATDGTGATMAIWNQWNPSYSTPLNDFWYLRQ